MRIIAITVCGLTGCFDFDAATRCYGDAAQGCETPSRCNELTVKLCDGFESVLVNPLWYVDTRDGSTVTVDETRAYRGRSSLRFHLEPTPVGLDRLAEIMETQTEQPTPLATRWIRGYLYVPGTAITTNRNRILKLSQGDAGSQKLGIDVESGFLAVENDRSAIAVSSGTALPVDRWVCVEVEVLHALAGYVRVHIDGNPISDLQLDQPTDFDPPIEQLRLGASLYQPSVAQPALDLWLDELVVDSVRGSCAL